MATSSQTVNGNQVTLSSQLKIMSPAQIYLEQIGSSIENIRALNAGVSYVPNQLGGIFSQQDVLINNAVLQVINFSVSS